MTQKDVLDKLEGLVGNHVCWKAALSDAIKHKYPLNVATLSKHDGCEFGVFVHDKNTARYLGRFLHYQDVIDLHTKFHREMGELAKVANSGEYERAKKMLDKCSHFHETSSFLIRSVMALKIEAYERRN
jgi:hypothetical protein